jgi:MoaA/NifB/PqqE/SkfB family radical SAM enzyme
MDKHIEWACNLLEDNMGFFAGRALGRPVIPPEHVYFSLTNRCNLRCLMCGIAKSPNRVEDEFSTEQVQDIVLQVRDLGVKHLILSGGEPLLRPDLAQIVAFASQHINGMVDIISNGVLLEDDRIAQLIEARLNHITISLDGLQRVHNSIRGTGTFEKIEKNIDLLNHYKTKYKTPYPTIGINLTIMDNNIEEMVPLIEFARRKRCNIIVFQPVLFDNVQMQEKRRNSLWPNRERIAVLEKVIKQVQELKSQSRDVYIYTDASVLEAIPRYFKGERPGNTFKCYEAFKRIVITYDGHVWSCMGVYGDLKKRSLSEIWFSQEAAQVRKQVKQCRNHCLQDCVYFPSNVVAQTRQLLHRSEGAASGDQTIMRARLAGKADTYVALLSGEIGSSLVERFRRLGLARELAHLQAVRREIG